MLDFKLQLGCLVILIYIAAVYLKEEYRLHRNRRIQLFDVFLLIGIVGVIFDGVTAYMVNRLEVVSPILNLVCHLFFLISIDVGIFMIFYYMLFLTESLPTRPKSRMLLFLPLIINIIVVIAFIPQLEYIEGDLSNYSMGISAYTCFIMAGVYIILTLISFFRKRKYMERSKRISSFIYLFILSSCVVLQMIFPQVLISSIATTTIILGIYLTYENPAVEEVSIYHREMVMGFATLVENKDGSTGGHIKRTTHYVKLLAEALRKKGYYKDTLTKDYLKNLYMAAPMHDIGKISVPDLILTKPGKLTDEEFEQMKLHTVNGKEIIEDTFGHLKNKAYLQIAREVVYSHHEKWDGSGYPLGSAGAEIPLSARIMAVADVFDALSEKRCYRDAMPLNKCFEIIREGRGKHFDPVLVDVFLEIRPQVEKVYAMDAKEEQAIVTWK